jgi:arylsulfatase A-like enzyme
MRTAAVGVIWVVGFSAMAGEAKPARPNIVWIVAEDASPHIGCYGETTIATPNLDRLAREGVRFTRAFITCPVCSPSRSAMVSGMYQTTLGAHNHRSQRDGGKGGANEPYYESYRLPPSIRLIPQLFGDAGYYVVNGGTGKTDYNFIHGQLYAGKDWTRRAGGQPFFAQFQLRGGKNRAAKVADPVDPADVRLPPYYPEHPVLREDWAKYLNSWISTDNEVGAILRQLTDEGVLENTVVFFWTDHGISHARGKQFLYDEGIHVPLIVRFPDGARAGTERDDLVVQIDVAATSLELAGIPVPGYVQGKSLFADRYQPRRQVFSARDRCDETADTIRCVRTSRFKYIRNFFSFASHMQPNQYKDGKPIVRTMRQLHADGALDALQDRIFASARPPEELYDLAADPLELTNLITADLDSQRASRDTANALRLELYQWMIDSGDVGLIPEPILEDLGRDAGSKFHVRKPRSDGRLMWKLFDTVEAGERKDVSALAAALRDPHPAVRWWAATGLGNAGDESQRKTLTAVLSDDCPGVRVAAAQALGQLGDLETALPLLQQEITNPNLVVGMYAIRGLELLGERARPALATIREARDSPYEFTQRIAERVFATLSP